MAGGYGSIWGAQKRILKILLQALDTIRRYCIIGADENETQTRKGITMISRKTINAKLNQWAREAEIAFALNGQKGVKMHRETWANGQVMVGWDGARANQFVPLARAIEIFRDGWKIYC